MASIDQTESFTVSHDAPQVRERVFAWFGAVPHTVVSDTPGRLEVKSGSQAKMRLLGGAFIAGSSLPTRTVVTMTQDPGGGTQVTIVASDAVGIGVKTGMKGKLEGRVAEIVTGLRAAMT